MNKTVAKNLCRIIKNDDVFNMLKNAKLGIKDWKAASKLNPSMSKGEAWNNQSISCNHITEYSYGIWEFSGYKALYGTLYQKEESKAKCRVIS